MITGSQELIRDMNRRLVLNTIISNKPMSRADISKKLELTKATISTIVQELIERQLILEIGSGETAMGRKPILLEFNKQCGHVLSIDISVQNITVMVSDLKGENCTLKEYKRDSSTLTFQEISKIIEWTIRGLAPTPYGVIGICLGIHGVVNDNEILFTPYFDVEESNLYSLLMDYFHVPVFVENEANLCVLGESAYHYQEKNMIYINIHSGIGMGILIDGTLYKGNDGYAGEIGHTILVPGGKKCPCGNEGCLEQYASEKAILEEYASEQNIAFVTIEKFIRSYQEKDPIAVSLIEKFETYMSVCINNIINIHNPSLIIINSSFTNYIPGILDHIMDKLSNNKKLNFRITTDELQDISELQGGVHVCVQDFLNTHSQIF